MVQALRLTRRSFLKASGGAAVAATLPPLPSAAAGKAVGYRITAKAGQVPLVGAPHPETRIWGYEGQVPGPVLRVRQGECLRVARSEEHTSELQSLMRISYAVFC